MITTVTGDVVTMFPVADTLTRRTHMGIDARLESKTDLDLGRVLDPRGLTNWLLMFAELEVTSCLQFIDPYGESVFNALQAPVLRRELETLRDRITDTGLARVREDYLRRTAQWPDAAVEAAHKELERLTVASLQGHLNDILRLVDDAMAKGPHHMLRFTGD